MLRAMAILRSLLRLLGATSLAALAGCPSTPESVPPRREAPHASASVVAPPPDLNGPPVAEKRPVVDVYNGVSVTDDYRWLEQGDDAKVKAWSDAQNVHARRFLDRAPKREAIKGRLKALMGFQSPDWFSVRSRGGRLFAMKDMPPKQQPFIVVMKDAMSPESEKVVLDPSVVDPTGGTSMDWYQPSLEGKLVAVSLATGGSESGTLHVYDVDGGKEHAIDSIPRVNGGTAGGSVTWLKDATGFYYTRYPAPGERAAEDLGFYQQVWFHKLGTDPKTDIPSLQKDLPRIAEIQLQTSDDGRFVLAAVANGDGGDFDQWILEVSKDPKTDGTRWRKFASLADQVVQVRFAPDGELWLRSKKDAPKGKLMKLATSATLDKAVVVVPESEVVLDAFTVTKTRLYTADLVGGPYQIRVFDRSGKPRPNIAIDPITSVWQIVRTEGDDVLVRTENYVRPGTWSVYRAAEAKLTKTPLEKKAAASFDDVEVVRETCTSKDGTKIPLSLVRRKGTRLDGSNKLLLTGYGGYGVSESPWFDVRTRLWLEQGGVYADANLRGGGELGEAWHKGGSLLQKQHVFDDFIACARHVVEAGYTRPERLVAAGASNGGLLMGAAITQAPELFRAVVSQVGIYDMLRVETTPNGAFNVPEFGTVKDKALFDAMYAYSPYHRVKDGAAYPAVLFMTGANDPRVDPYNSRKMVARMQAASPRGAVLLRTSGTSGHGVGTPLDQQIDEQVDFWSFLLAHADAPAK
jgi:prolyl oligopeptidase